MSGASTDLHWLCHWNAAIARDLTHTHLTALFPGLPRWAGTRKVKPIWILLKQETVSGSGISWAICKLAPCSRQTTTPAPHHSICLLKVDPFLLAHPVYYKPVCIQFPTSADNMTLLTFAAERHVAAALGGRCCWLILPTVWAHSSKPTTSACSMQQ